MGTVLYLGSTIIYKEEADKQHQKNVSKLSAAARTLDILFAVFQEDLLFLRDLSLLKTYVASGFQSGPQREHLERLFQGFLRTHLEFHTIELYDEAGNHVLSVKGDVDAYTPEDLKSSAAITAERYSLNLNRLKKDGVWLSPATIYLTRREDQVVRIAIIGLSTLLPGSDATRKTGYMTLSINLGATMEVLPAGVEIQTGDGKAFLRKPDGSVKIEEKERHLKGDSGWLSISPEETIHYIRCTFLSGQPFYLLVHHKHPGLRTAFRNLIWLSIAMLVGFSGLAAAVGFITISRYRRLVNAQYGIIFSLAALAEGRDPETGEHLERTRQYAKLLARQLRERKEYRKIITADYLDALYAAAPLHDIGKVGIPDAILLKASGLTDEEYETMKTHVLIGNRVLKRTMESYKLNQKIFTVGLNIATFHHEKYDGRGYPEGLKGEEIPLEARIFALCDAYDAIRIKRPYKGEISHEEAVARILEDKGKHFDPLVVEAFIQVESQFKGVSEEMK
ncbi:MAG: HD domain-containing phosphohydrolase [Pseudomonadota bacterium]